MLKGLLNQGLKLKTGQEVPHHHHQHHYHRDGNQGWVAVWKGLICAF
jgi:hypothetical protein